MFKPSFTFPKAMEWARFESLMGQFESPGLKFAVPLLGRMQSPFFLIYLFVFGRNNP